MSLLKTLAGAAYNRVNSYKFQSRLLVIKIWAAPQCGAIARGAITTIGSTML